MHGEVRLSVQVECLLEECGLKVGWTGVMFNLKNKGLKLEILCKCELVRGFKGKSDSIR